MKQMAAAPMPPVEPDTVTDIEPLHRPAQIRLRQLDHQVIVIIHQHERVQTYPEPPSHFGQQPAKMFPIPVVSVNGAPFIAAPRYMIPPPGTLDTQWSGHAPNLIHNLIPLSIVQCRDVTPIY